MGLDLYIQIGVKNKKTGAEIGTINIAYWRNHYGLRDRLLEFFTTDKDDIISIESDVEVRIPVTRLPDVIDLICQEIMYYARGDKKTFGQTIWFAEQAAQQTIEELGNLVKANDCIKAIDEVEKEDLPDFFESLGFNTEQLMFEKCESGFKERTLEEVLKNIDDYELQLVLVNSY